MKPVEQGFKQYFLQEGKSFYGRTFYSLDELNTMEDQQDAFCYYRDGIHVVEIAALERSNTEIKRLEAENAKLKRANEIMKGALEVIGRGESQFDNVNHMHTARKALKEIEGIW